MSIEQEDFDEVLVPLAQEAASRFKIADEVASGEESTNIQYETVGRLKELERLCHNYAEYIIANNV